MEIDLLTFDFSVDLLDFLWEVEIELVSWGASKVTYRITHKVTHTLARISDPVSSKTSGAHTTKVSGGSLEIFRRKYFLDASLGVRPSRCRGTQL